MGSKWMVTGRVAFLLPQISARLPSAAQCQASIHRQYDEDAPGWLAIRAHLEADSFRAQQWAFASNQSKLSSWIDTCSAGGNKMAAP